MQLWFPHACRQTTTYNSILYYCSTNNILSISRIKKSVLLPTTKHQSRVWCNPLSVTSQFFFTLYFSALDELMRDLIDPHRLTGFLIIVCPVLKHVKRECDLLNELNKGVIRQKSHLLLQVDFRELRGGFRSASSKTSLMNVYAFYSD